MDVWDGTVGDGFSEGRWNAKAIPIMNWLVQMGTGLSLQVMGQAGTGAVSASASICVHLRIG